MTQQTINGTVYRVGQELRTMTEAGPFIDAWIKANNDNGYAEHPVSKGNNAYPVSRIHSAILPVTIKFLPNPDPVAEDWREVELKSADVQKDRAGFSVIYPFYTLQLAMQEVCKAGPYNTRIEYDSLYEEYLGEPTADNWLQRVMTCFLLGGRVFVKGGV